MLDVRELELQADEHEIINHPLVGGVILFSRNYESPEQITALCQSIRDAKSSPLLIAVDQEGGRVQRFRKGFTLLPASHQIGEIYDTDQTQAKVLASTAGWLMASELLAVGIDFSFAPVLDLYKGVSQVIGDRAFHRKPEVITLLAKQYIKGMKQAGMSSVGKHFPGHGSVEEDSHVAIPRDSRRFEDIQMSDIIPFENLILANLHAIMPAHVIYPNIDPLPAGFSKFWLQQILREQLNFNGVIFSDDLSMTGAEIAGDYLDRVKAALAAGCDMALICNQQSEAIKVLDNLNVEPNPSSHARLMRMRAHTQNSSNFSSLCCSEQWIQANQMMSQIVKTPELDFGNNELS